MKLWSSLTYKDLARHVATQTDLLNILRTTFLNLNQIYLCCQKEYELSFRTVKVSKVDDLEQTKHTKTDNCNNHHNLCNHVPRCPCFIWWGWNEDSWCTYIRNGTLMFQRSCVVDHPKYIYILALSSSPKLQFSPRSVSIQLFLKNPPWFSFRN